jgi:hypothetical protein
MKLVIFNLIENEYSLSTINMKFTPFNISTLGKSGDSITRSVF